MSTVSGGFGGVSSAITYSPACRADSIAGLTPSVAGRDQDALVAPGDGGLDRGDLGGLVAVLLAGRGGDRDVVGLAGLLGALLHGDEERVGAGLGDQGDRDLVAATGLASRARLRRRRRRSAVNEPAASRASGTAALRTSVLRLCMVLLCWSGRRWRRIDNVVKNHQLTPEPLVSSASDAFTRSHLDEGDTDVNLQGRRPWRTPCDHPRRGCPGRSGHQDCFPRDQRRGQRIATDARTGRARRRAR